MGCKSPVGEPLSMIGNEIHRIPSKWVISFIADYLRPTTSRGQGQTREEMSGGRKGRKERCTPLAKPSAAVLKGWLREQSEGQGHLLFPNVMGEQLSVHGMKYMLNKHAATAAKVYPSLKGKRVTVHAVRHTMALEMLQTGVDRLVIALWLGHESVETTQIYLEATLAMKEQALAKTTPPHGSPVRFRPNDRLLSFLNSL